MTTATKLSLAATLVVCLGLAIPGSPAAQDRASKTMTVVVPLGAGSASDIIARVVMEQVSKQIGRPIVVENRPGAGGISGANVVANAAPDGLTILVAGSLATVHALHTEVPYDTLNAFTPVIPLGQQPLVLVVAPAKGYKMLDALVAAGKAKPGALNYSSAGVGSASHFAAERVRISAGFEAQHIPFRGAGEATTEVVTGRVDFSAQPLTNTLALISEGKLSALAVSSLKRTAAMPQVPTTIEAGLRADSVYPFYSGMFVPARTPRAIVERLHQEAARALQVASVRASLKKLGVEPMTMTVEQFGTFFREDVEAAVALAEAAKIPMQ